MKNNSTYKSLPIILILLLISFLWFSCKHTGDDPVNHNPVTFTKDIIPILNASCNISSCHSGSSPAGNLKLEQDSAYYFLFKKSEVDTLHPEQSTLYIKLNSVAPTMPPTGRLPQTKIDLFLDWIKQGAKR